MRKYWGLLLVLLLSFGAIVPLLQPGFFPIHDNTQVVRVQQMAQALGDGQFPVRWVGDLGYGFGYPIFNFYAPLAYYFGAIFNLIGFNALLATKLMFITGILLAGILMYFLAREFWGEIGGVLSGLLYIYVPYHAVDIYVRGAVGEFWAMAFLPLIFLGIYKLSQEKSQKWVVISALAYAAIILSHNLTAMIITPIILLIVLILIAFSKDKKIDAKGYALFILLALGLSAFYWLPALVEMKFTQVFSQIGGGADWRDHFIFLDQLWASPWGFAGSALGRLDGMSFMIGKLHLVLVILSLLTAGWLLRKGEKKTAFVIFSAFGLFALSLFFTNQVSSLFWELMPPLAFIQYPWRFLVLATFTVSFIAGAVMLSFRKKPRLAYLVGGVIVLILLAFNTKYFQPQTHLDVSVSDYINEENIKWQTSKISDEYLPKNFPVPQSKNETAWEKVAVLSGEGEISDLALKSHQTAFKVKTEGETKILVNTAYFPGWKLWLDGEEVEFSLESGKIKFTPPPGEHQILVRLKNTPVRAIADLISLIAWAALIGLLLLVL